jgi:hypothetical protein
VCAERDKLKTLHITVCCVPSTDMGKDRYENFSVLVLNTDDFPAQVSKSGVEQELILFVIHSGF